MSKSDVLSTILGARYQKVLYCRRSCARAAGGLPADVAFYELAHTINERSTSPGPSPGELQAASSRDKGDPKKEAKNIVLSCYSCSRPLRPEVGGIT